MNAARSCRFERGRIMATLIICLIGVGACASTAEAGVVRGLQQVLAGIFQIPIATLAGTFHGPPVIGTVVGAANGVISGVGLVAHGALELALSGVSLAKAAAPYVLPFIL